MRLTRIAAAFTGIALLLAPATAQDRSAAAAPPASADAMVHARPALWRVRDKDTTIYLFGTIHLLKPGMVWLEGPRKSAFDSAQELVMEIGEEPDAATQVRVAQLGLDLTGPALSTKLPEDVRGKYFQLLTDYGAPTAVVEKMKPWFAAVTITALPLGKLGYNGSNGVEAQLRQAAIAQGKAVKGLETTEEQLGIFNSLSPGMQIALLVDTINEQATLEQSLARMIEAWSAGDPVMLAGEINKSMDKDSELQQRLLLDRNNRWADWIKARLDKPGTVFLAVGAGHLAGKGSVQDALKKRGVKAALLPNR